VGSLLEARDRELHPPHRHVAVVAGEGQWPVGGIHTKHQLPLAPGTIMLGKA
jgi:hypothetical protein